MFSCFGSSVEMLCGPDGELPEKLRNLEPHLIEHVSNEIMDQDPNVWWDDSGYNEKHQLSFYFLFSGICGILVNLKSLLYNVLAGLEHAKKCVKDMDMVVSWHT